MMQQYVISSEPTQDALPIRTFEETKQRAETSALAAPTKKYGIYKLVATVSVKTDVIFEPLVVPEREDE